MNNEQDTIRAMESVPNESIQAWADRWKALDFMFQQSIRRVERLRRYIKNLRGDLADKRSDLLIQARVDELEDLIARLRAFGREHFYFFYRGFLQDAGYRFEQTAQLAGTAFDHMAADYSPAPYVLKFILEQITFDLFTIDQVTEQRFMAVATGRHDGPSTGDFDELTMRGVTRLVDDLAVKALMMMQDSTMVDTKGVDIAELKALTYYRMAAHARIIPYANLLIIGLPLTSLRLMIDLLAIPHEIGHYFYWNGIWTETGIGPATKPEKATPFRVGLQKHLQAKGLPASHPWLEEIVADCIGCLIGGPITAWSIQEILKGFVGAPFLSDNGTHPTPAIRPYLYSHMLRKGLKADKVCDLLDEAWGSFLHDERKINLNQVIVEGQRLSQILMLAQHICDAILEKITVGRMDLRWSTGEGVTTVDQLVQQFKTDLGRKSSNSLRNRAHEEKAVAWLYTAAEPEPMADSDYSHLWRDLVKKLLEGQEESWLPALPDKLEDAPVATPMPDSAVVTIPAETWLELLEFGGWTDEGGTGGGNAQGKLS